MEFRPLSVILLLIVLINCEQTDGQSSPQPEKSNTGGDVQNSEKTTPKVTLKSERTAVFIGETVTLTCEIEKVEETEWTYSWFKDEQAVQPPTNHNVYWFEATTPERTNFTCTGTSRTKDPITTEASDPVTLSVSEKPTPNLTVKSERTAVFIGETVNLTCEIKTTENTEWTYSWNKNGIEVQSPTNQNVYRFMATTPEKTDFTCRGTSRTKDPITTESSNPVSLSVSDKPRPKVTVKSKRTAVFIGETVNLTCKIETREDIGWSYIWNKDGTAVQSPTNRNVYRFVATTPGKTEFTCRGTSRTKDPITTESSDPVSLSVSDKPRPKVTVESERTAVFIGETVNLTCEIETREDTGWSYIWNNNGTAVQSPTNRNVYRFVATTPGKTELTCRGTSRTKDPITTESSDPVSLSVSDLPAATLSIKPSWSPVFTGESVTLKCEIKGYNGWRYQWYKGSSRTAVSESQINTFTFTISSAADQDQYWCRGKRNDRPTSSQDSDKVTLTVRERPIAVASIPNNQVFVGETVTLTCSIQGGDASDWQYSWFKEESSTPVIEKPKYTISSVRESDSGEYSCRGMETAFLRYSNPSTAVRLTVSALPTATLTVDPASTVFSGESFTLKCEISTADQWIYQWEKQRKQHGWAAVSGNKASLTISGGAGVNGDQYRCRGKLHNRPISLQYSNSVTLTVHEKPAPVVNITPANQVFRGERVTLRCELKGGGGEIEEPYIWKKEGNPVSSSSTKQQLTIQNVRDSDSGEYFCSGTVKGIKRYSHTSTAVTLTVFALPTASLTVDPASTVFTGESVTLKCEISTADQWIYQWEKQRKHSGLTDVSENRDSLTIRGNAVVNGDQYRCRGELHNKPISSQYSKSVTLTVLEKPKPVVIMTPDNQVFRGESVTLRCDLQGGGDFEWMYSWYKQGNPVSPYSSSQQYEISYVTESHRGDYSCSGTVRGTSRSSHTSTAVTLTVFERPAAVLKINPANHVFRGETVTIRCDLQGGRGDFEWTYYWYPNSVSSSSTSNQYTISSVTDSHRGVYYCFGAVKDTTRYSYSSTAVTLTVSDLPTASLTVAPDSTVFTGGSVTLKCEITGNWGWRYQWYKGSSQITTSTDKKHTFTISSAADQDQYWCKGTRDERPTSSQDSNKVTLTVKETPKPELKSSLTGAALIGNPVTLYCNLKQSAGWRFYWFKHTQTPETETTTDTHSYTIRPVNVSDGGQYWCRAGRGDPVYYTHYSDALWVNVTEKPKALVSIKPDNHVFEREKVTLRCDIQGGGDTQWRYSWYKNGETAYPFSSSQDYKISYVNQYYKGEYTCRGQRTTDSQESEISDAVTLTVSAEPQAVLSVSPQNWLTEGDSVTLSCEVRDSSTGWNFSWYKAVPYRNSVTQIRNAGYLMYNDEPVSDSSRGSGGSYTLSSAALNNTGVYMCRAERGEPAYHTQYSKPQPLWITASSPPASLIISPSRSQHFSSCSLSLICEGQSNSTGWRVRRYSLSESKVSDCSSGSGSVTGSTCSISYLIPTDTGVYWCESESGGSSNAVNITVHNGDVILESPVHPVTEGVPLTLRCLYLYTKPSDPTAYFYRNNSLLQTQTTGEMIIPTVSKSDEGLYHCKIPEKGESPQSWISVRVSGSTSATSSVPIVLALGLSLTLFLIIMLCVFCCYKRKKKGNQKDASVSSVQNQNIGAIPLQAGNDHIYDDVGVKDNNNTDDSVDNSSDVTYTQVKFSKKKLKEKDDSAANVSDDVTYAQVMPKKKPKGKDKGATEPSDVTYSLIQMKTLTPCSEDEAIPGPSDANPGPSDANPGPSDVVYSQIQIKPKKQGKDATAEPSDVTYAEIDLKDKKNLKENQNKLQKDADAGPSDLTYAEIDLKDKKKPKKKPPVPPKGKGCAASNTVYSELKQHLQRP